MKKKPQLPKTDSIEKLAKFWDTHDVTDFADDLEVIDKPVFGRRNSVEIQLPARDVKRLKVLAQAKGMQDAELARQWVLEKIKVS